jgi:hypothetical protein
MSYILTYNVASSFDGEFNLRIEYDEQDDADAKLWVTINSYNYSIVSTPKKPKPEIFSKMDAEKILEMLSAVKICPIPNWTVGCDGTQYELEIIRGLNSVHYSWWPHLPDQWESLKPIVDILDELIDSRMIRNE